MGCNDDRRSLRCDAAREPPGYPGDEEVQWVLPATLGDIGAWRHLRRWRDVCPVTERRSLKTEQRKPKASAGDRVNGRKVNALRTDNVRFWCQSAEGFSSPGAGSPIKGPARALDLDGEFDPGSGRTLAACLTHASRARSNHPQGWGRPSG